MNFLSKLSFLFIFLVSSNLISSCSSKIENGQNPIHIEVLKAIPVSEGLSPKELPRFSLEAVSFKTLKDLNTLSGEYFSIETGSRYDVRDMSGSIVNAITYNPGSTPHLRYHTKNGTIIPDDYETLMYFSSYYQFETIFENLEKTTGIRIEDIQSKKGKLKVVFHPAIHQEDESISTTVVSNTNAAFVPLFSQFWIMPSSKMEDTPLGGNLQVISHEFGHFIFDYLLGNKESKDKEDHFFESYAMKGLNEGFADFYSYTITGSSNVLGASFGWNARIAEERNFTDVRFDYDSLRSPSTAVGDPYTEIFSTPKQKCKGKFYCYGTLFAKSLYQAHQMLTDQPDTFEGRARFFRTLVVVLQTAHDKIETDLRVQRIRESSKNPLREILEDSLDVSSDNQILENFFRILMGSISDQRFQKYVCQGLSENFGDIAFPKEIRRSCR